MRENEPEPMVRDALRQFGFPDGAALDGIRVLTTGMSGSSVLAFRLDGVDVVLKGSPRGGQSASRLRREHREVMFYRDLAGAVPVSVPRMLGSVLDEGDSPLLLLAASEPAPEPRAWTDLDYTTVACQLGRFHAAMQSVALPGWVNGIQAPKPERCAAAVEFWPSFAADDEGIASASMLARMEQIVGDVLAIDDALDHGPVTLCHGDFHAGNFLRDPDGGWLWADWQEVRCGYGVDDLAFFWERAFAMTDATTEPPFVAMVDAYWDGLVENGNPGMTRDVFERALAWAELHGWLIEWPPYIGMLSRGQQERVIARIRVLLDWWDANP